MEMLQIEMSMTQDIIQRNLRLLELESLNGYMVELADKRQISSPFNRVIYFLGKEQFQKDFQPMDANDVRIEV